VDIVKMKRGKIFFIGMFAFFLIIIALGNISAVCCERTTGGGKCIDVGSSNYCSTENNPTTGTPYKIDNTACGSTPYCSTGTCVNNAAGTCTLSTDSACDPSLGGYWVNNLPSNIPDCKPGCCLIGDSSALVPLVGCREMSKAYGFTMDFKDSVTTVDACLQAAGPTTKGACVSQTTKGRTCDVETKEACTSASKDFHAGLLCTAPQLGTVCTIPNPAKTKCVDGKNEVYFADSCGNPANVYDSSKLTDTDYWTYIKDPTSSDICGYGNANTNNPDCGNCNYLGGSTCGKPTGIQPSNGNYICKSLSCTLPDGTVKAHGSSWCNQPLSYFETAKPGDLSYRFSCFNGEVQADLCDTQRNSLCNETDNVPVFGSLASCIPNKWQYCIFLNNSKDCLSGKMDCNVQKGIGLMNASGNYKSFLDSSSGSMIKAACVPKYPPGFNFWTPDAAVMGITPTLDSSQACAIASSSVLAGYHAWVLGNWNSIEGFCFKQCIDNCSSSIVKGICQEGCFSGCPRSESFLDYGTTVFGGGSGPYASGTNDLGNVSLDSTWATNEELLSVALGDCGVKANYIGQPGYNSWKDLFIGGNISSSSIPNGDSYT
jgi:hypothetical protein